MTAVGLERVGHGLAVGDEFQDADARARQEASAILAGCEQAAAGASARELLELLEAEMNVRPARLALGADGVLAAAVGVLGDVVE